MICCCCSCFPDPAADLQHSSQSGVVSGSSQGQSRHSFALKCCQDSGPPDAPGAASAPLAGDARAGDPANKQRKLLSSECVRNPCQAAAPQST